MSVGIIKIDIYWQKWLRGNFQQIKKVLALHVFNLGLIPGTHMVQSHPGVIPNFPNPQKSD